MLLLCGVGCADRPEPVGAQDTALRSDSLAVLPLEVVLSDAGAAAGSLEPIAPQPVARMIRVRPAAVGELDPPLPDAEIDAPAGTDRAPLLLSDPGLKPPIPKGPTTYVLSTSDVPEPPFVELEVLVDTRGMVRDVAWASGTRDSLRVAEATACAFRMEFFPALLGGEPVQVWCRQRFDYAWPQAGR